MIASNWPVVLLKNSYDNAWNSLLTTVHGQEAQNQIKSETAQRWYNLQPCLSF
jgi:predicted TIM-barrel fold metal-dependent hydrolase